jgi:triphosphoribosyl-dephospho-CoA synthase
MHWSDAVTASLLIEVGSDKLGNVRPGRRFRDVGLDEFVASAFQIGAVFDQGVREHRPFGETVWRAMQASLSVSHGHNVHLGSILALAPLVYGYRTDWPEGVQAVIRGLTLEDTAWVFRAIQATQPRWLAPGQKVDDDVYQPPTRTLIHVFRAAQDYDWIAREYVRGYSTVFTQWVPFLEHALAQHGHWGNAVAATFYRMLADEPDSLWIRKNGRTAALEHHQQVRRAIATGDWATVRQLLDDDDNRWNPGTSADLIGATILVAWVKRWSA